MDIERPGPGFRDRFPWRKVIRIGDFVAGIQGLNFWNYPLLHNPLHPTNSSIIIQARWNVMAEQHPMPYIVFLVLVIPALWLLYTGITDPSQAILILAGVIWILIVAYISASVKIADQWERAVILRAWKIYRAERARIILHCTNGREGRLLD